MPAKVYLTRRNLLTLLSKLDRKGKGEKTACTLIKKDNLHEKYPQTMKSLSVIAVENGGNFTGTKVYLCRRLLKTLLSGRDPRKAGKEVTCVAVTKEAHPKKAPKVIEVLPLENEEYYTGMRLPGDVCHADEPEDIPDLNDKADVLSLFLFFARSPLSDSGLDLEPRGRPTARSGF